MMRRTINHFKSLVALTLVALLSAGPVWAGITVTGADGITVTGADGVSFINTNGITVTGADAFLSLLTNGISTNGITVTGADMAAPATYTGPNSVSATNPDGITVTGADGITVTGADGITVTGADGTPYNADVVTLRQPNGITVAGADGSTVTGADGINRVGGDGITVTGADGITVTGADGITVTGADGITVTGADGQVFSIPTGGVMISGPSGITVTGADGITVTGADGITVTGADMGDSPATNSGLQSLDPELAVLLNKLTDDSNVNAVVIYHSLPGEKDIADLQQIGVLGGTRYRALPMVVITATRRQLVAISRLPAVRSIYGNRTLQPSADANTSLNNAAPVQRDPELTKKNLGMPLSGRGVTVAVLDTGVDSTHADLSGRVVQNVKLVDAQGAAAGFLPPVNIENLPNTDQVYGHGTFVAGIIAGNGSQSGARYGGLAPGAQVLGLSAGDLNLSYVLAGFDYILSHPALNTRVVNCSFSANTVFDLNDPVNVATRLLTQSGINVVVSAGNTGSGTHTLNPYAVAPWVISVGATDKFGALADFSSRGDFGSPLFRPTLVAPGVNVVSLRTTSAPSVLGAMGLSLGDDRRQLTAAELPYYTTGSGTSFSAPQVTATVALMLETNPKLTPAQVKDILQRSATPIPGYYGYEVGAGMLNAYGAVIEAAFPERHLGVWKSVLDEGQVRFVSESPRRFSGTAFPVASTEQGVALSPNTLLASMQVGWGTLLSATNLSLAAVDPSGKVAAQSNSPVVPGITGGRERIALRLPSAGGWRIRVTGGLGLPQNYSGLIETVRVEYPPLKDLAEISAQGQQEALKVIRTFVMSPIGTKFRPSFSVSRGELAEALVKGGKAPQYLPDRPSYSDLRDRTTLLFVESVQKAPVGPLFLDVTKGGPFRPDDRVTRLTAAVALVRAAGLTAEAESSGAGLLAFTDLSGVPASMKGYVATATSHGLLTGNGSLFRPQDSLTRAELAHAMSVLASVKGQ